MKFNLIFARQQAPAPPSLHWLTRIILFFSSLDIWYFTSPLVTTPLLPLQASASDCHWSLLSIISVASFANNHVSHQMACRWARAACPCLPCRPRPPQYTDNSSRSNRHNSPQHKVSHLLHAAIFSRAGDKPLWSFTITGKAPTMAFSRLKALSH